MPQCQGTGVPKYEREGLERQDFIRKTLIQIYSGVQKTDKETYTLLVFSLQNHIIRIKISVRSHIICFTNLISVFAFFLSCK